MNIFIIIIILVPLILNGLWYWTKSVLKENGYHVSWFWGHFRDIPNIFNLAGKTNEPSKKRKYYSMAFSLTASIVAFPIVLFTVVPSIVKRNPCDIQNRFKLETWNGIITNKYLDKPNHNNRTIEIQNELQTKNIQNWYLLNNGNYQIINVGDSIAKNKNSLIVELYQNGKKIALSVDFGCE